MKDIELNKLPFEKAIIHDKRNFFQYYYSQIKYSHILIFTFLISIDGNARIIKLFLFMFYISLSLFFNVFFFEKKNISYIYQNKGKMDYFYSIEKPIINAFVVENILIFFIILKKLYNHLTPFFLILYFLRKKKIKKNDKFPKLYIKDEITVFPSQEILTLNANIVNG